MSEKIKGQPAFRCSDGRIFFEKSRAIEHQVELIIDEGIYYEPGEFMPTRLGAASQPTPAMVKKKETI